MSLWLKLADRLPRAVREKLFWLGLKKFLRKAGVEGDDVNKILELLGGWKTKAGALVGIGTGLALIGHSLSGKFSFEEVSQGFMLIAASLGLQGLGGKAEKLTAATLMASPNTTVVRDTFAALDEKNGSRSTPLP